MVFSAMSIMLLIGVLLRAKVGFIQKAMIPSSLLGGFLGFILVTLGWLKFPMLDGTWQTIKAADFLPYAFHAFNISFISLCLTRTDNDVPRSAIFKGGMWLTVVWSASLTIQALVGGATVVAYNMITTGEVSPFLGYLVTHGFTQGPGQALAVGGVWAKFKVPDAVTMGLIWATMGFVAAYVVGVPYARSFVNKGLNVNKRSSIDEEFLTGIMKKDSRVEAARETTHSASVETLAYHVALIGLVYLITYFYLTFIGQAIKHPLFSSLFSYPVFFLHGLIWALIIRKILDKIGIGFTTDPGMQKRITGLSVDFLLVSSIMGISFTVLSKYIGVIIAVTIAVTAVTFFMVEFLRRRVSELSPERAVSAFGCCCGSTASGLLLLRILDADYSTPVGLELAFFNVAIVLTTMPIIVFAFGLPGVGHMTIIGVYVVYALICLAAAWFLGPWKKKAAA
jgi:ESS family glutamate:Na+ symporter